MTIYQKQTITELTKVASEALNMNEQAYKIKYYEKTDKFTDKIAIYFLWRAINNPDKEYAKRSTYFLDPDQLRRFIQDSIQSYLFFLEKRLSGTFPINLSEHRVARQREVDRHRAVVSDPWRQYVC